MFAFVAYFSRASDRHWFLSVINALRLFSDGYGTVGIGTFNSLQIGSHPSFGLKIINCLSEKFMPKERIFCSRLPHKDITEFSRSEFKLTRNIFSDMIDPFFVRHFEFLAIRWYCSRFT